MRGWKKGFRPWLCFSYLTRSSKNISLAKACPQMLTHEILFFHIQKEKRDQATKDCF